MAGDDQWFNELYLQNAARMVRYASAQLRSRAVGEELVEDAFVILLRKREELAAHPNPAGWLWKTLQHLLLDELKSARNRLEVPLDLGAAEGTEDWRPERLEESLPSGLTPGEREILILYFEEELSHEEIARRLGITNLNSRARLCRAKNHCRALLEKKKSFL